MEIITLIATKISDYAIDAIFHQLGYLVNYKDNLKSLKEQAEDLVLARSRVQHLIDEAKNKAEDVEDDVVVWLTKVDEITEEANGFLINFGEEKEKHCLNSSCFNLVRRHRLSRKAKKMINELADIHKNGKFDKVSYRGPLPGIDTVVVPGYLTFESRMSIIEEIKKTLTYPNVNMIGVYGMGGVGKTILVKEISYQVKKSELFEHVIIAIIGQNPNLKHVQGQLADMLCLEFHQETEYGRAALLRKRLHNEKNILIVLDDIWDVLDLERVGITSGDGCKGCKILVTSRSKHVLSTMMSIEKNFEVTDLTPGESWELFKNMVDEKSIEVDLEKKKVAMAIVVKCGKLPIAIVTVAKALKGKASHTWRDALRQLNNPSSVDIEGANKEVFASLKLSYDYLNCRGTKLLFLLCSMFPDDYDIDREVLVRYGMGLKFLQGIENLGTTRDKILTMIDDLESSCLLQKSNRRECVKMHDVVRDIASYIASKDDQMCTLSYGKGLREWKDGEETSHGNYTAIYMNCVNFQNLHEKLNLSKLELLTLVRNMDYDRENQLEIPQGCFEGMRKLKVLHLEGMRFSLLPSSSSLDYLVNLRTLLLIDCQLGNIDMIGELKNLEILDFSRSDIMKLPLSTRQLVQLKQLKFLHCEKLMEIPFGVISRLTKLEEIYIHHGFNGWEWGGSSYSEKKNASLSEFDCLPHLSCVYLCIRDVRYVPEIRFLNKLELESFQIIIGMNREGFSFSTKKMLYVTTDLRNVVLNEVWVSNLMKKSEVVSLEARGDHHLKNLILELSRSLFPYVRELRLQNNEDDIEYLMSELDDQLPLPPKGFSNLGSLILVNIERLVTLIQGYTSFKTLKVFENLRTIEVSSCDKMKYLFPFSIIEGLSNLEKIEISYCRMMEAIVGVENNEQVVDNMEFKQLRDLKLSMLPELKSFCGKLLKAEELIKIQSNEIVEEESQRLFTNSITITPFPNQITFPNLKKVEINLVKHMVWHDLQIANNFSKLERIDLNNIKNLKSVFIGETMKNIKEPTELYIRDCYSLEEVFTIDDQKLDEKITSNLEWLHLQNLPNLKQVWNKDPADGFQFLKRVDLVKCPNLETLFPPSLIKHLQQLKYFRIHGCGIHEIFAIEESETEYSKASVSFPNLLSMRIYYVINLETIWHNRLIIEDMSKLQFIMLVDCKSLKSIFTSNVMRVLKKLKDLYIKNCDLVVDVFEINLEEDSDISTISLRNLHLCNLPSLKRVWSNDPNEMYQFQNLNSMEVIGCPKLKTFFPPSLARELPKNLQSLNVDESVDVIFMEKDTSNTSEAEDKFEKEAYGKKVDRELCHPKHSSELHPTHKVSKSTHFSLTFYRLLYGLETLKMHKGSLVEIFSYDIAFGNEENHSIIYSTPLKRLHLREMPKLLHIWKESSQMIQPLFDNLEVVDVGNCGGLNTLVISTSFSFQSLKELTVNKCHGLRNLFSSSMAKTLVCLKTMSLCECKRITTVFTETDDEREEDEFVFAKLEILNLYDLPDLRVFRKAAQCSIIRFPSLRFLDIQQCPEMKMFSLGIVCAPLLKSITFENYWNSRKEPKKFWAGNINATIQQLWEEDGYGDSIHNLFKEEAQFSCRSNSK